MSYQAIQLEIDQASNVATITLNRPDKLNSFTRAMHRELQSALDDVEAAGARALILTGAGRGFCAGQDLADLDFTPGAVDALADLAADINDRVENIGARRLATVLEKLLEEISFTATDRGGELVTVDAGYVNERVAPLAAKGDLSRFIL